MSKILKWKTLPCSSCFSKLLNITNISCFDLTSIKYLLNYTLKSGLRLVQLSRANKITRHQDFKTVNIKEPNNKYLFSRRKVKTLRESLFKKIPATIKLIPAHAIVGNQKALNSFKLIQNIFCRIFIRAM